MNPHVPSSPSGKLTNPLNSLRGGTKTLLKTFLQTSRFCLRLPLYVFRLACLVPRATHTWTLLETKILINPLVSLLGGPRALSISNCFSSSIKYEPSGSLFARYQEVGGSGVSLLNNRRCQTQYIMDDIMQSPCKTFFCGRIRCGGTSCA